MTDLNTPAASAEKVQPLHVLTEKVDALTSTATESLQKLAQRVQDEATPYVDKARELADRAEVAYQDAVQTLNSKIEAQTSNNETAQDVIALLKEAQREAEAALHALRADFELLRKSVIDLQNNSEVKNYISQLLAKIFESTDSSTEAAPIVAEKAAAETTATEAAPVAKTTTRRKKAVTPATDSDAV